MTYCSLLQPAHPKQSEVTPVSFLPLGMWVASHSSCPGVEKYSNFDSEMLYLAHACFEGTIICLLAWQMHYFQCVLVWLQVTWQSILGVLSRLFSNAFPSQLPQVQAYCFNRSLCPWLFSCYQRCVTLSRTTVTPAGALWMYGWERARRFRPAHPGSEGASGGDSPLHCAPIPNSRHYGTLSQNASSDCFDVLSKGGHMCGPYDYNGAEIFLSFGDTVVFIIAK